MMYEVVLLCLLAVSGVHGYSGGAPIEQCHDMTPSASSSGHGATTQTSTFPYDITFSATCFKAGDKVSVTIKPKSGTADFEGVFIQARKASAVGNNDQFGTWNLLSSTLKTVNCRGINNNAVSHKDKNKKSSETVQWVAPSATTLSSNVVFRVTVVQTKAVFWTKQDSATLTYSATCSGATSITVSTALVAVVAILKSIF